MFNFLTTTLGRQGETPARPRTPGAQGSYPLRAARARHRTGTPAHVVAWRERADAELVERAREYGVQDVPRVRLAFAAGDWHWARRIILAEIGHRARTAAGKVPF